MGEGLGEVAQLLSAGADLLGEHPDVVGVRLHLLEGVAGLRQAPRAGEGVDVEERVAVPGTGPLGTTGFGRPTADVRPIPADSRYPVGPGPAGRPCPPAGAVVCCFP